MGDLSNRGPLGLRSFKPVNGSAAGRRHMGRVKALDCVVCGRSGPSDAHHCRSDGMARDDFKTIPLCKECHQGQHGYHNAKSAWEATNGKDHEYLAVVADMINGERNP